MNSYTFTFIIAGQTHLNWCFCPVHHSNFWQKVVRVWYKQENNSLIINVYVQPGAKRTEISGLHGEALKIRLASPPIDGRANDMLLKYIALLFNVPLRQVELKRGNKSRHKKIAIIRSKIEPSLIVENNTPWSSSNSGWVDQANAIARFSLYLKYSFAQFYYPWSQIIDNIAHVDMHTALMKPARS